MTLDEWYVRLTDEDRAFLRALWGLMHRDEELRLEIHRRRGMTPTVVRIDRRTVLGATPTHYTAGTNGRS